MTMTKNLVLILILMLPAAAMAADTEQERPHWSVEAKYGLFYPDISNWSTYYGSDRTWDIAGAVGYKLLRQVEVGVEAGMMRDTGRASAPTMGVISGNVEYSLWPLNVYVLVRAVFSERQWIVPYAGGGWTRMYYQEKITGQSTIRGSADGYHGRAGIQVRLDGLDPSASNNLFTDFGIRHTYLIVEAERTHVMANVVPTTANPGTQTDIGGTTYFSGFLFEF